MAASIESVFNQTYQKWELILIDDCSIDDSLVKAREYCEKDKRVKLITLECNSGAAVARNKGIEVSQGRFIAFLDSDDTWLPEKLNIQTKFMLTNDIAFSYTAYMKVDEQGRDIVDFGVPLTLTYSDLLKTCAIGCLTVVYDTAHLGKQYMPLETKREDYALWLKIMREKEVMFYGINNILASYRVYPSQSSSKKIAMAKENWNLLRKQEGLYFLCAIYYFSQYALRGTLRGRFPLLAKKMGFLAKPDNLLSIL